MKAFYFLALCFCFMCAYENSSLQDCDREENPSPIKNELDFGQKFCDSKKHLQKQDDQFNSNSVDDENLKKFEEFLHSIECSQKTC
ncbi:hypothetical protein BKH42_03550 [Helicobacter sp. 13S00482-2]|uniref:hypothetical protein n=1 Tax=Helicobacter sp. 13S00482-2 TaxID=1476200 RepID=UPI000BA7CFD3|nr:hypothetical protein [Helicobacter sp. 13S00482-2]PAF53816.1 hypothetical protein BKH42_03550 [Helicobacter sp. 13S00482-2]